MTNPTPALPEMPEPAPKYRQIKCGNRMLDVKVCENCGGIDGVFHNKRTCTPPAAMTKEKP